MRKKIGIVFPPTSAGGVHQYALSIAQSLITHVREFDYAIIHDAGEPPELFGVPADTRVHFVERVNLNLGPGIHPLRKIAHFIGAAADCTPLLIRNLPAVAARAGTDLLVFPTPLTYDLPIGLPYVATIPDVQHRYMPDAPDYGRAVVKKRDIIYGWFARHSLLNTADSEQGRDDVERFLRAPAGKTRVIPYIPANYIYELRGMPRDQARALLDRHDLPERFVFYPAQFWYQKNHDRLIRALHAVRERHGVDVPLVAVGNGAGRFREVFEAVRATVRSLRMEDLFRHLGYVSNREMVALYRTAVALVAPPLQGPTTLPPIEALLLSTPVVTARLYDVPKQVGDAALLFDPYDVDDMAAQIHRVWTDAELRASLIARGDERARAYLPERFAASWHDAIRAALDFTSVAGPVRKVGVATRAVARRRPSVRRPGRSTLPGVEDRARQSPPPRRVPQFRRNTGGGGLRNLTRDVLPHGVVRAIRRRNKGIVGDYRTWEAALRASGPYRPEMATLVETVRRYRDGEPSYLNRYDPSFRGVSHPLLAGLLTAGVRSGGHLGVLDFGGSLGQTWFGLEWTLRHLPSTVWCVVDQAECVEAGRSAFESERLRFHSSVDEATAEHDLNTVVCSSTLQYLEEPYDVVRMLADLRLPHLILDRTAVGTGDGDRFMRQHTPADMGGDAHPLRTLSIAKLDAVLAERYVLHDDHSYGPFPMEGDAATYRYSMYVLRTEA